jgi:hypothetical protein
MLRKVKVCSVITLQEQFCQKIPVRLRKASGAATVCAIVNARLVRADSAAAASVGRVLRRGQRCGGRRLRR